MNSNNNTNTNSDPAYHNSHLTQLNKHKIGKNNIEFILNKLQEYIQIYQPESSNIIREAAENNNFDLLILLTNLGCKPTRHITFISINNLNFPMFSFTLYNDRFRDLVWDEMFNIPFNEYKTFLIEHITMKINEITNSNNSDNIKKKNINILQHMKMLLTKFSLNNNLGGGKGKNKKNKINKICKSNKN
jgi:hypothetical protein